MEEGTSSKAIPLRRSRAASRAVSVRSRRWTDIVAAGLRYVLEPPRQVWLAGLGGTALTLRGVRASWALLVTEGANVETRLRRSLAGGAGAEAQVREETPA